MEVPEQVEAEKDKAKAGGCVIICLCRLQLLAHRRCCVLVPVPCPCPCPKSKPNQLLRLELSRCPPFVSFLRKFRPGPVACVADAGARWEITGGS